VEHVIVAPDEIFEHLVVGEVSRRAVPHPKDQVSNFFLLRAGERGVELHPRFGRLRALLERDDVNEMEAVRLRVRGDAIALNAGAVVVALLLR
jgi:hypothetical protein